ncbi:carboxypeptidase-like regulatory domain-containing protein [Polaromonas sp. P1(28)-13]|nr:carboxypeptidase-like regulatory domain-containing protein [Polaromonas sp. P1(28)-13]
MTFTATVAPVNPANNPPGIAEANNAMGNVSTTRGTAPRPDGGDGKLPGIAGDPVPGTEVGLEGDPGSIKVSATTGPDGAYQFTGLPAGKYKLTFPGLPAKSITIGTDGKTGGKVLRDGNNVIVTGDFEGSPARSKASANPVPSFLGGVFPGMGSVMGGILPGMSPGAVGPGAGPMSPAAGPMGPGGPAGPMGPGAGAIRR